MNDFKLSGYQISHPALGTGCTGSAYSAQSLGDQSRELVVKTYQSMAIDRDQLEKSFTKLAQMPAIDEIADPVDWQLNAVPYYSIVKHLAGKTLDRRPILKEDQAWQVIKNLTKALGHAHKYDVVHTNLHPTNIHFTENEDQLTIQVTDFGVGLCGQYHHLELQDNAFFLAPEQLLSQGRDVTVSKAKKWDVYSFGVVAYWLLTDHLPRAEEYLAQRTHQHLTDVELKSIDPSDLGEKISQEEVRSWERRIGNGERNSQWLDLINQCLEIDPDNRPVDLREVNNRFLGIEVQLELKALESSTQATISNLEANHNTEKKEQRSKLFSARLAATILAISCLGASYLVVMFVNNSLESRSKINSLDQVVETQQESLSEMDRSISETAQFLKQSRSLADDAFYKLTQQADRPLTLTELDQSRRYYCRVLKEVENKPLQVEEHGRALHSLAHIENLLSKKNSAAINFELAIDCFETVEQSSDEPTADVLIRLADCYEYVGLLSDETSTKAGFESTAQAIDYYHQVLDLRPTDKELALRLATCSFRYGRYLYENNQFDGAIHAYSDSAKAITKHRDQGNYLGDTSGLNTVVASLQFHAAEALKEEGLSGDSISSYIAAIESAERLQHANGYNRDIALLMCRSFVSLGDIFDHADSIDGKARDQVYNEALRLISPVILNSPKQASTATLYCQIASRLADLEYRVGNKKDGYQLSLRGITAVLAALEQEPNYLPGFLQLAEARLVHLQFINKDKKLARKIAMRGLDTAKHAHNLVADNEVKTNYQYRGRSYNQLRHIFDGYGNALKNLGESKGAAECFEYASYQFTSR